MSQLEEQKAKDAKKALKMLITISGTDIIMPEPKREEVIKQLGLEESIEFHRCMAELSLVHPKAQYKIIQGLMVSFLTSNQLMDMGDYAKEVPKMIMGYCAEHKEYLHMPTPEEFAAGLGE